MEIKEIFGKDSRRDSAVLSLSTIDSYSDIIGSFRNMGL